MRNKRKNKISKKFKNNKKIKLKQTREKNKIRKNQNNQ